MRSRRFLNVICVLEINIAQSFTVAEARPFGKKKPPLKLFKSGQIDTGFGTRYIRTLTMYANNIIGVL